MARTVSIRNQDFESLQIKNCFYVDKMSFVREWWESEDFERGVNPSEQEPERFYHGFVLGMMVELSDRYALISNRENGFGRYDVMLDPDEEEELADTAQEALNQIEKKQYEAVLRVRGIPSERIRKYDFAFCAKGVLIGKAG